MATPQNTVLSTLQILVAIPDGLGWLVEHRHTDTNLWWYQDQVERHEGDIPELGSITFASEILQTNPRQDRH